MEVKNNLAESLLKTLFYTDNPFSLADDFSLLQSKQCFDKTKQYIDWINQINVNSVMIISTPSIDALCLCYALVLTNKTYIPVHTSTSSELLKIYLKNFQVDLLLVQPQLIKTFDKELKSNLIEDKNRCFFYYLTQRTQHTFCLLPGVVFFTSGTTAEPKAVHHHYDTLHRYLSWCLEEFKLNYDDNFLFTTELSFIASLRPLFVPALSGARISFIGNNSTNKLQLMIKALLKMKTTILNLTPTLFKILVHHIEKNKLLHSLSSVRLILLGGETIDITVINHWFSQIKADTIFYNLYSATEYLVPFYKKINSPVLEKERLHLGQLREGSNYKLVPDPTKGDELYIAGDISTAYFDKILNQSNFIISNNRRFIKTNDFVKVYHQELFFCTRSQRLIKRYGQLINLDQIEYVLKKCHNALNFIIFLDEGNENKIYLIISGSLYDEKLLSQIKLNLNTNLPSYMHPNEYIFTKKLPLTPSGKIDYFLIKKMYIDDQVFDVSDYFKRFFREQEVNMDIKIVDLGLQSIDYIEMAEAFLKITGKWLDVSKINEEIRISNIASCLVDPNLEKSNFRSAVKINSLQRAVYSLELDGYQNDNRACIIASFCLRGDIAIKRLEIAIAETLSNHFMLNSRLEWIDNDYFFVSTDMQSDFSLQTPIFFPKRKIHTILKTSVHSDRLVRIYIQKKKNQYFLIMAYHHIVLDGWSAVMVREEIFHRYEGTHKIKPLKKADEIDYLNKVNQVWMNNNYNIKELKSLLLSINYSEYNHLDSLFNGILQKQNTCFAVEKDRVDTFAGENQIEDFPYSVIFALLLHQIISQKTGVNKLFFYMSFSNRNLPVPKVKELLTNLATGLPVFFDSTNLSPQELALQIKETLRIYFKNMSYGGLTEIWDNEIISRRILNPKTQPYIIIYTYINKIADNECIQNNYIDWNRSTNEISPEDSRRIIFLRVYNMGSDFVVNLNTHMNKGLHNTLTNHIKELMRI